MAKNFTDILVEGEISNAAKLSPDTFISLAEGLKNRRVRCVWFKQHCRGVKMRPEDGLKNAGCRIVFSVYEARGEYRSSRVDGLEDGVDASAAARLRKMKKRLEATGLFDTKA